MTKIADQKVIIQGELVEWDWDRLAREADAWMKLVNNSLLLDVPNPNPPSYSISTPQLISEPPSDGFGDDYRPLGSVHTDSGPKASEQGDEGAG